MFAPKSFKLNWIPILLEESSSGLKHVSWFLVSTVRHTLSEKKKERRYALCYCSIFVALECYNMENI